MSEYGFPASAIARLNDMKATADSGTITTSELSINEMVLVDKAGFQPIGLCLGSCMYHVGFQFAKITQNQELTVLSQAMYNAREQAMVRMRAEARAMGADGVIGVKLSINRMLGEPEILEFVAIGTGVVHAHGNAGFKAHDGQPFTSHLSGQEFWTLLQARMRPVEMVMGSCVYHIARRGIMQSLGSVGRNVELLNFTQANYDARETAMQRMQAEAKTARAESIVAITLDESSHTWESHVTEFFAFGTAVVSTRKEEGTSLPDPQLVLSVNI